MTVTLPDAVPAEVLAGSVEDIGLWLAVEMEGRFRYEAGVGQLGTWRRKYARSWVEVHRDLVLSVAMQELEHAYYQVLADDRVPTAKLERLTSRQYVETNVMHVLRMLLTPAREA